MVQCQVLEWQHFSTNADTNGLMLGTGMAKVHSEGWYKWLGARYWYGKSAL